MVSFMYWSHNEFLVQRLRKPQRLRLDKRVTTINDLGVFQLATSLAHIVPGTTENALMKIGGELYQAIPEHHYY